MKITASTICGFVLLMLGTQAAGAASISRVRHLPPAEATPGEALTLTVTVAQGWESNLEVHYRHAGDSAWQSQVFTRQTEERYVATIPAAVVTPPGVEYYLAGSTTDAGAGNEPFFASAAEPHRVNVFLAEGEARRTAYLARHDNRRSRIHVAAEYVDYGARQIGDKSIGDYYYRVDADISYRLLSLPLASLRFGYTHLIGQTPRSPRGDDGSCRADDPDDLIDACTLEAGIKGGGWFELLFVLHEGIELDARGMVMATQEGFNVGGRTELRIGDSLSTYVAIGGERIADVGAAGFVRLAWGTVPGLPMAATVEVTDFPAPHRDTAVRLIYDIARPLPSGVRVGGRIGYQARDQLVGGITLGLGASFDF